jgi:hypothetical protein
VDALLPKGYPDMPADHKTAIPDEGQGEGKKQARGQEWKFQGCGLLHFGLQICQVEMNDQQS